MKRFYLLLTSLALVLSQVAILLLIAPQGTLSQRYLALNNWDSFHYKNIAERGYSLPANGLITSESIHQGLANAVFFPGYPLAARALSILTGFSTGWALPLTAQLAALVFWFYLMLYLKARGVGRARMLATLAVIAIHPAAFYLATGYTESLFLASMMGFVYWSECKKKRVASTPIAALHGFVMSATRIVAFAPAAYPFFLELRRADLKSPLSALLRLKREIFLGAAGISGAVLFFSYCQFHFGRWNLYFELEQIGWGNERRWFAIFNPLSYVPRFFFENSWDSLNRLAVTWTAGHLIFTARTEWRSGWKEWPLWLTAFVLFYIPLTGKASANMDSMLRYTLPVTILLLVLQAAQSPGQSVFMRKQKWVYFVALLSFALQLWCSYRFLRGRWIA